MTKHQRSAAEQLMGRALYNPGAAARVLSALIRSAMTDRQRAELLALASTVSAVTDHPDFII